MGELVFLAVFIFLFTFGLIAYRKQARHHQNIARELTSSLRSEPLVVKPRATYYGLASRGAFQPHELLAVLVINSDQIRLVVPPVGLMSKIDLKIKIETIDYGALF